MPRVTEEYREGRRTEILAAAARRFARDGFHATSMADVIGEAGLSAGAVYGYFRSKEELIAAVAEAALATTEEGFARLLADGATPAPEEAVEAMVQGIIAMTTSDRLPGVEPARLVMQVWAEALRSPVVLQHAQQTMHLIRGHFVEVARRWQAVGGLPADADPEQVGTAILALAQGYTIQRLLLGQAAPGYLAGVRALLAPGRPQANPQAGSAARSEQPQGQ